VILVLCEQNIELKTRSGQLDSGRKGRENGECSTRANRELRTKLVGHVERVGKINKSFEDS